MAIPVINNTQSVLGYLQWQAFGFQPLALNSPTNWSATALPPGLSINATTGLISGSASLPGVYVVGISARNADGTGSAAFTICIEASAPSVSTDLDVVLDVVTRRVALAAAIPPQGAVPAAIGPLAMVKQGDDLILSLQCAKGGVALDLDVTALTLKMKERDGDAVLVTSDAFIKLGSGADARYRVHAKLAGDALLGALSDFESDTETLFPALCELEMTYNNPTSGVFAPSTLQLRSDHFTLTVARNFA